MLKKIPKKIKALCKKHHVRLTYKKNGKKNKKTICVLLKELKVKVKKSKKSKFGESLPTDPVKKENYLKRKAKETVKWVKANPKKAALGLIVGAGTAAAAAFAAPILIAGGGIAGVTSAASAGLAGFSASGAAGLASAGAALKNVGSMAGKGLNSALNTSKQLQDLQSIPGVSDAATALKNGMISPTELKDAIEVAPVVTPFGKRTKFGNSNYLPSQQVFNFGKTKTVTKSQAMKILRNVYRKNCKN